MKIRKPRSSFIIPMKSLTRRMKGCYNLAVYRMTRIVGVFLIFGFIEQSAHGQENLSEKSIQDPVSVTADELEFVKEHQQFSARGSVEVVQGEVRVSSDEAFLDRGKGHLTAKGNVNFFDGLNSLTADEIEYDFNTDQGTLTNGTLQSGEDHFLLTARILHRRSEDRYALEEAMITTCEFEDRSVPLWQIQAREADVRIDGYLTARHVIFRIKSIPVFYFPYVVLPVKTKRQSGFLVPHLGYSNTDGFTLKEDFFWAIAPNQDATFSLDYRGLRGTGGGIEYRYILSKRSEGKFDTSYFNDREERQERVQTHWNHRNAFSRDFQFRADLNLVNDPDQFRDLDDDTGDRVKSTLDSTLVTFYRRDNQYFYLLGNISRDLYPVEPFLTRRDTVQRLPEIGYTVLPYAMGMTPFFFEMEATGTYFWMEEEAESLSLIRTQRVDIYPRILAHLGLSGWSLRPRVGWRETWYARGLGQDSPVRRSVPIADIKSSLRWWRAIDQAGWLGPKGFIHTVEPTLSYEYVPKEDQDKLPKYDAIDQINPQSLLTYALESRIISYFPGEGSFPSNRRELLFLKVTQSYDVRERRMDPSAQNQRPFSNLRGEVAVRPTWDTHFEVDTFYDLYAREVTTLNMELSSRLTHAAYWSVGHRLTRRGTARPIGSVQSAQSQPDPAFWFTASTPAVRFYTGSLAVNFPIGVSFMGQLYYDAEDRGFAEENYTLSYDDQCWAFGLNYIERPDEEKYTFYITLKTASLSAPQALQRVLNVF